MPDITEPGAAATMCEAFVATAGCHPRKVALRTPGGAEKITWEQYASRVRQTLRALRPQHVLRQMPEWSCSWAGLPITG